MKLINRLLAGTASLVLATPALAGAMLPPVTDLTGKTVTPRGASTPITIDQALSGARFLAPRSYRAMWKPFTGTMSIDTGTTFAGKTIPIAIEVPNDFIAARLIFANQSGTNVPPALSGCAVSGSSQWGIPGSDNGATLGVTAFDNAGSAITSWTPCSFGNGGADLGDTPLQKLGVPAAYVTSQAGTTTLNSFTLTLSAANANIAVGQVIVTAAQTAGGMVLQPLTTVTGITDSTHITISNFPNIAASGVTFYFLPPGATIPAASVPPIPSRVYSDWLPVTSYARIDGPIVAGETVQDLNGNTIGTVQTVGSATAQLVAPLTAKLAAGTQGSPNIRVCQTLNTSALGAAPAYQLTLNNAVGVYPGMVLWMAGIPIQGTDSQVKAPANPVTAVNGAVVSVTNPIGPNTSSGLTWSSGATVYFELASSAAALAANGQNTITVSLADAAKLSNGMQVRSTGISTTISSVNTSTGVVTLAGNLSADVPQGTPIHFFLAATLNGSITSAALLPFASTVGNPIIRAGDVVEGAGIPANTLAWAISQNGGISLTQSPTAQVASGAPIQICKPMTTVADAPAGSSTLTFRQTTYERKLFLARFRFANSPTNANYFNAIGSQRPYWFAAGLGGMEAANCSADGVSNISAISNTSGCGYATFFPIEAVEFYSPRRGIVIAAGPADSTIAGDSTPTGYMNFVQLAFAPLSTPDLPISVVNFSWGGQNSYVFDNTFLPLIQEAKPDVVVIAGFTGNDPVSSAALKQQFANMYGIARTVQGYGGLPILVGMYPRQSYGRNMQSNFEPYRQQSLALERATTANGIPFVDAACMDQDPVNGPSYHNPANTIDDIHDSLAGHTIIGVTGANGCPSLRSVALPYLGN